MSKPYEVVTPLRDFGVAERESSLSRGIMRASLAHAVFPTRASHVNIYTVDENAYEYGRRWDFEDAQ